MKVINVEVLSGFESLKELVNLKLPVKTSYRVAKTIKALQPLVESFNESARKLQETYGAKDDEGKLVTAADNHIKLEDPESYNKEWNELLQVENDVSLDQLNIDDFGSVELEPKLLLNLSWLLAD